MKTVIMAGGYGTRIASVASDIPKPMIKIDGVPVLEREIDCLRKQGLTDIYITVSYLGQMISDYFGDGSKISPVTGKPFGVSIKYYHEKKPLGNAGALYEIKDELSDDFLLLNADSVFDVDFRRMINAHKRSQALATILVHPNSHPYDSGLIFTDPDGYVSKWSTKEEERPEYYRNLVNAGLHVLSKKVLNIRPDTEKVDLDRQILKPIASEKKIFAYVSPEYIKDMGTPERYRTVCEDYKNGIVHKKNLLNRQKAIFLDRDGTINKYVGFLTDINDFELLPGVSEAVKRINRSGYLAVVVTNQPVVARGEITIDGLNEIHNKMETLLGEDGAYLDRIYYCPHHPDSGFSGEVKELKCECECRKPKPGMLIKAAEELNIDLSASWMIGDRLIDIETGINAGTHTALIENDMSREKDKQEIPAEIKGDSLLQVVNRIIK